MDWLEREADRCSQHPLEVSVCFCAECDVLICHKCLLRSAKHCGHEAVELSDGVLLLKQRVRDALHALRRLADGARLCQSNDARRNLAQSGNTVTLVDLINRSINEVINELETIRTNLTTHVLRSAQQQFRSSVSRTDQLTSVHLRRSALQNVKQLHDSVDCSGIFRLKLLLSVAEMRQDELQLVTLRQQALHEQLQAARAQVEARTSCEEHWKDELRLTVDRIDSLRQYTDVLVGRRPCNPVDQTLTSVAATVTQSDYDVILCFGGHIVNDERDKEILMYSPVNDKWHNVASLGLPRYGAAATVWNNTVIVAGGHWDSLNSVEQYDPQSNTCKSFANLLFGRCMHALVNLNETLFAIGGRNRRNAVSCEVEKFIAYSDNSWQLESSLSTARCELAASTLQDCILVAGGDDGSNFLSSCELFDWKLTRWSQIACLNKQRRGAAAATNNNTVFVFGGSGPHTKHDDAEQYEKLADKWTVLDTHMSVARSGLAAATVANEVYLLGGMSSGAKYTDVVQSYNFQTNEFCARKALPSARCSRAAVGVRVSSAALSRLIFGK